MRTFSSNEMSCYIIDRKMSERAAKVVNALSEYISHGMSNILDRSRLLNVALDYFVDQSGDEHSDSEVNEPESVSSELPDIFQDETDSNVPNILDADPSSPGVSDTEQHDEPAFDDALVLRVQLVETLLHNVADGWSIEEEYHRVEMFDYGCAASKKGGGYKQLHTELIVKIRQSMSELTWANGTDFMVEGKKVC